MKQQHFPALNDVKPTRNSAASRPTIAATLLATLCALIVAGCAGVKAQPRSGFQTLAHEVLRIEHPIETEYAARAAVLDEVIRRSLEELDRTAPPVDAAAEAKHFFQTVDNVLVEHNFVFPSVGLVSYLGDALVAKNFDAADIGKLVAKGPNLRRIAAIEKNMAGNFFVSDCDTNAMVYLAVAEVRKFPCYMVEIPGHNFVRWSDASVSVNWETNYGTTYSDENYQSGAALPDVLPPGTGFMRNFTRTETLSYWTALAAAKFGKVRDYTMQAKLVHEAFALDPHALRAGNELAWFLATCPVPSLRDGKRAVSLAETVVAIWPDPNYLDTLAAAYAETRDFDGALKTETLAVETAKTWRRSGFDSSPWPNFSMYVEVYRQRKTYAEHEGEPKPAPPQGPEDPMLEPIVLRRATNGGEDQSSPADRTFRRDGRRGSNLRQNG